MSDVIKSYLVSLSTSVDKSAFDKFASVLKTTENTVVSSVGKVAGEFLKFQIAGTTAFATVGFGLIAYIDKLGQADLKTKLLATQNMMSLEQYRSVSIALKALGVSLNDVFFGPKELQDRFHILIEDQKQLAAMLGPNYEQQMQQVRDVSFQLDRLEVKGQYFGMKFASDLLRKLGFGDGGILKQLENLNDFIMKNMPAWSDELSSDVLPIFNDFIDIMADLGQLAKTTETDFVQLVGALAGDTKLENSAGGFRDFSKAISDVVHWLGELLKMMARFEGGELKDLEGIIHYGRGLGRLAHGDIAGYKRETALGNAAEAIAGGQQQTPPASSSTLRNFLFPHAVQVPSTIQPGGWIALAQEISAKTGIDARLIYGQMANESGRFKHFAGRNNLSGIKIPGTNTFQDFASLDDYASRYASILNERRYVENGIRTARTGAEFAAALKTKSGTYYGTDSQADYAKNVDTFAKQYDRSISIAQITVYSAPNFTPDQHVALVKKAVKDGIDEHTRALIAETNGAFQ